MIMYINDMENIITIMPEFLEDMASRVEIFI